MGKGLLLPASLQQCPGEHTGTVRTEGDGLGISGGRVSTLDPCSCVCPFLWGEAALLLSLSVGSRFKSYLYHEEAVGPLCYRDAVHDNLLTASFQISYSSSLVETASN